MTNTEPDSGENTLIKEKNTHVIFKFFKNYPVTGLIIALNILFFILKNKGSH